MAIYVEFIGQGCNVKDSSVSESWENASAPPRVGDKVVLLVYADNYGFGQRRLRVTEVVWYDPENVTVYVAREA